MVCCCLPTCCPTLCSVQCGCCPQRACVWKWQWIYFTVFSLSVLLSWVLRDYYASRMDFFPGAPGCCVAGPCPRGRLLAWRSAACVCVCVLGLTTVPTYPAALHSCATEACFGKQAVLRVRCAPVRFCGAHVRALTRRACCASLGTCLFFALLCAATLGVRRPASWRGHLHTRLFLLKVPFWAGLVALAFLPSNAVLETYFQAARAGGALFLLLQLVIILDCVVTSNETWLDLDDSCSRAKLVLGASVCNAGALVGAQRSDHAGPTCAERVQRLRSPRHRLLVHLPDGEPARRRVHLSHAGALCALHSHLAAASGAPEICTAERRSVLTQALPCAVQTNGGIFTSGAVSAYCTYLCATAIMSDPERGGTMPRWLQAVGFAIALFALVYSTATAGGETRSFDVAPAPRMPGENEDEEPEEVHPLSYSFFHFVFALGAMYAAMLFTSWTNVGSSAQWSLDKGAASMWVKIGCEWAAGILYLWILSAPLLCTGRDFT